MKKLPKKLFVKWADTGDDEDTFLICSESCDDIAGDIGGIEDVGVYELTFTGTLATKVEFQADRLKP